MSDPQIRSDNSWQQLLQKNQALQESIRQQLCILAKRKAHNRLWALYYTQQLSQKKHSNQQPSVSEHSRSKGRKAKKSDSTTSTTNQSNLYGKRQERFFMDLQNSQPAPNMDTVRRRQLESATFFHHTQPPWSSAQDKELQAIAESKKKRQRLST